MKKLLLKKIIVCLLCISMFAGLFPNPTYAVEALDMNDDEYKKILNEISQKIDYDPENANWWKTVTMKYGYPLTWGTMNLMFGQLPWENRYSGAKKIFRNMLIKANNKYPEPQVNAIYAIEARNKLLEAFNRKYIELEYSKEQFKRILPILNTIDSSQFWYMSDQEKEQFYADCKFNSLDIGIIKDTENKLREPYEEFIEKYTIKPEWYEDNADVNFDYLIYRVFPDEWSNRQDQIAQFFLKYGAPQYYLSMWFHGPTVRMVDGERINEGYPIPDIAFKEKVPMLSYVHLKKEDKIRFEPTVLEHLYEFALKDFKEDRFKSDQFTDEEIFTIKAVGYVDLGINLATWKFFNWAGKYINNGTAWIANKVRYSRFGLDVWKWWQLRSYKQYSQILANQKYSGILKNNSSRQIARKITSTVAVSPAVNVPVSNASYTTFNAMKEVAMKYGKQQAQKDAPDIIFTIENKIFGASKREMSTLVNAQQNISQKIPNILDDMIEWKSKVYNEPYIVQSNADDVINTALRVKFVKSSTGKGIVQGKKVYDKVIFDEDLLKRIPFDSKKTIIMVDLEKYVENKAVETYSILSYYRGFQSREQWTNIGINKPTTEMEKYLTDFSAKKLTQIIRPLDRAAYVYKDRSLDFASAIIEKIGKIKGISNTEAEKYLMAALLDPTNSLMNVLKIIIDETYDIKHTYWKAYIVHRIEEFLAGNEVDSAVNLINLTFDWHYEGVVEFEALINKGDYRAAFNSLPEEVKEALGEGPEEFHKALLWIAQNVPME